MKKQVVMLLTGIIAASFTAGVSAAPLDKDKILEQLADNQKVMMQKISMNGEVNWQDICQQLGQIEECSELKIPDWVLPGINIKPEKPNIKPDMKPDQDENDGQIGFVSEVVKLVNQERIKAGLSALSANVSIQAAAQVRAEEQKQSFSHTRPNGSHFSTALTQNGISFRSAGENIAIGQKTPQQVMDAWMNSEGHRANILNPNFTAIGVGYTQSQGNTYWAQLFMK